MYLICTQDKWVRFLHRAPEQKFFDILALNSPVDELAKSPHFECGVWRFDSSRGIIGSLIAAACNPVLKTASTERYGDRHLKLPQ